MQDAGKTRLKKARREMTTTLETGRATTFGRITQKGLAEQLGLPRATVNDTRVQLGKDKGLRKGRDYHYGQPGQTVYFTAKGVEKMLAYMQMAGRDLPEGGVVLEDGRLVKPVGQAPRLLPERPEETAAASVFEEQAPDDDFVPDTGGSGLDAGDNGGVEDGVPPAPVVPVAMPLPPLPEPPVSREAHGGVKAYPTAQKVTWLVVSSVPKNHRIVMARVPGETVEQKVGVKNNINFQVGMEVPCVEGDALLPWLLNRPCPRWLGKW